MLATAVSYRRGLLDRMQGPGGCYNLGNALGLLCGLMLHAAATPVPATGMTGMIATAADYLVGSPSAVAITLAMVIFFWSGELYHRAWAHGAPPDPVCNRKGDLSSGVGALLLGLGLLLVGDPLLAATAGLLHAFGKFGSALPPAMQRAWHLPPKAFRWAVLASRLPAVVVVLMALQGASSAEGAAGSVLLLGCYALWIKADLILLRADG